MRSIAGLLVILVVGLLVSCTGPETELTDRTWQLSTLDGAELVEGTSIDMTLEEDTVSGSAGCNSYTGPATYGDGDMTLGPDFAATLMICDDATSAQETKYLNTLAQVTNYELESEELLLQDDQGVTIATFE